MGPAGPEEGEGGDAAAGDGECDGDGGFVFGRFYRHALCCQEQLERQQSDGKLNSDKHAERKRELNLHLFPESPAVSNSALLKTFL